MFRIDSSVLSHEDNYGRGNNSYQMLVCFFCKLSTFYECSNYRCMYSDGYMHNKLFMVFMVSNISFISLRQSVNGRILSLFSLLMQKYITTIKVKNYIFFYVVSFFFSDAFNKTMFPFLCILSVFCFCISRSSAKQT